MRDEKHPIRFYFLIGSLLLVGAVWGPPRVGHAQAVQAAPTAQEIVEASQPLDMALRGSFENEDLLRQLARLSDLETQLEERLREAEHQLGTIEKRAQLAREALLDSSAPSGELLAREKALRLRTEALRYEMRSLSEQLYLLPQRKAAWRQRYETLSGLATREQLRQWREEARGLLTQLDATEKRQVAYLAQRVKEKAEPLEPSPEDPPAVRNWRDAQHVHLARHIEVGQQHLSAIRATRHLHEQLLKEIEERTSSWRWIVTGRLEGLGSAMVFLWNKEITSIDSRSITVGKIALALFVLALGAFLSRLLSRLLVVRVLRRTRLDEGAVSALQSIAFYLFLVIAFYFTFEIANIPLTIFSFFGGALAIGVGFGSQNILNNFISGLILMVERPIRVGDLIEVAGTYGKIIRIGARCTQVRTPNNIDIMVPNSSFLEGNVINWTLTDDLVRTQVTVGVAYGSPTAEVAHLIRRAVDEHDKVLQYPEPVVLFSDFGDNALLFEVHFWIHMPDHMHRRRIESDIRSRIDGSFREAGITIAIPQRDVHLDSHSPIQVKLVDRPSQPPEAGE